MKRNAFEKAVRHTLLDADMSMVDLAKSLGWAPSWIYDVVTSPEEIFPKQKAKVSKHLGIERPKQSRL